MAPDLPPRWRPGRLLRRLGVAPAVFLAVLGITGCSSPADNEPLARPSAQIPCDVKPGKSNTGPSGALQDSPTTVLESGQTLENARVASLEIRGKGVTVRNVEVTDAILITGDDATLDHVSTSGIAISSASGATVQYVNVGNSAEDGIHVTSDRGRLVKNVLLKYNYIHTPQVPNDAHYDGTQVRGVDGLVVFCSTYDPGAYRPQYNAAVYLEDANGGDTNVSVEKNWLYGFGFSVMVDANKTRIVGNRVGGDIHWGTCSVGRSADQATLEVSDNVKDDTNAADPMCSAPTAQVH